MIAGQFQSQGQKISYHRIHLQNLRDTDGFSWLVKDSQGQSCWRQPALNLLSSSTKEENKTR